MPVGIQTWTPHLPSKAQSCYFWGPFNFPLRSDHLKIFVVLLSSPVITSNVKHLHGMHPIFPIGDFVLILLAEMVLLNMALMEGVLGEPSPAGLWCFLTYRNV